MRRPFTGAFAIATLLVAACGGGGGSSPADPAAGGGGSPAAPGGGGAAPSPPARSYAVPAPEALTATDVGTIVARGVAEAKARGLPAVIAVTDRVGNVLAIFRMTGARVEARIPMPSSGIAKDAQGVSFPAPLGAIAKAITAAYLSSGGNAFTTRTASQIVQEHFPPAASTAGLESGPLFGVQFSQLPCSDLSARYAAFGGPGSLIGPKRSPLGLSADPGGVPLYKNGVLVGGVGVMGDGVYGFDPDVQNIDEDAEEYIAVAAASGFAAPTEITANRIAVDGTSLRFVDATPDRQKTNAAAVPGFATIDRVEGTLVPVRGYYAESGTPALLAGTTFGTEASGIRAATAAEFDDPDAFVLTDGAGVARFPVRAATDNAAVPQPLSAAEVRTILQQAFAVMRRARAQIRMPLDSRAQVSISIVDTYGAALGLVRAPDAPLFGTDVALQKARTAAFFSASRAGTDLSADPSSDVQAFAPALRTFLNDPSALTGRTAFTTRAIGNLSRPYFPDGELRTANGPLSRPIAQFSPFSTGLQSALIIGNIAQHLGYVANDTPDTPPRCTALPDAAAGQSRAQNGIQIFPGSVPIYRGNTLVGAIGVSGDGIDQDDMISFLGVFNAGQAAGGFGEAPAPIRADRIVINSTRLRYVSCPFAPFLGTSDQNVCEGK